MLVAAARTFAAGPVTVAQNGNSVSLSNDFLSRTIEIQNGVLHTTQLLNKLSGASYRVWGDEFRLNLIYERVGYEFGSENPVVLTARSFRVAGHSVVDLPDGGKQLVFRLTPQADQRPQLNIRLDVTYTLNPGDFFTRQELRLSTTAKGTYFISSIGVLRDHFSVRKFSLGGFGQPLFGDDLFMGLEYPTSINTVQDGDVSLRRYVGVDIPPEGYASEAAVVGVAANSAKLHWAFMDYVRRMRIAPVRPYLLYNTWFDLRRPDMTEQNLAERVRELNRDLLEKYPLHLNSFVLDDGWDDLDHLWHADPSEFPNGFGSLVQALKGIHSGLGLWFSPIGGYIFRSRRIASGRKMGMEITSNGQFLCLAGRNYSRYFRDRMLHYEKLDDINYFKIDGTPMGCNVPGQGYPLGIYSREANVGALIGVMKALRAQNPRVFLNITTSIWMSPWWLRWADTVWMGGEDSGYLSTVPAISLAQSAISYRDSVLYNDYVRHQVQFPMSSIMTHGIIRGQHNWLGGKNESLGDWDDDLVHYFSVGNMMIELYLTPSVLSPAEWQALGRALEWQRANATTLLGDSTMVLGDPAGRNPYGFVHSSRSEAIVTLRNPFVQPRFVSLKLDRQSGFEPWTGSERAEIIYPYRLNLAETFRYGDTLHIQLGAYQQKVICFRPVNGRDAGIEGVRYELKSSSQQQTELILYAPSGSTEVVRFARPEEFKSVLLDGRAATLTRVAKEGFLPVRFGEGRKETQPSWSAPDIAMENGHSTVSLTLGVPNDFSHAKLTLLVEPATAMPGVTASARDNGRAVALKEDNGGHSKWYWFIVNLSPGQHRLNIALNFPKGSDMPTKLSGWLLARRVLASKTLTLNSAGSVKLSPSHDLLPHHSHLEAVTYPAFSEHIK